MKISKVSALIPLVLVFTFAYLAARTWDQKSTTPTLNTFSKKSEPAVGTTATTQPQAMKLPESLDSVWSQNRNIVNTLKSAQGAVLFNSLFKNNISWSPQMYDALQERFANSYKDNNIQTELTSRLGILKALAQQDSKSRSPSSVIPAELATLYKTILSNDQEHWMVKRQAFKNLKSSLSAEELNQYYATLDNRAVHHSNKSESEMLTEVLSEKVGSN
ncbi:hypothetical protein [Bdellovibrio sp. HCB209]|uniref:hypothetical protein n=1 Tax=Bdellovibrio sp. HCB209 TaxID=3394354 RepID=UPI0039B4EAA5